MPMLEKRTCERCGRTFSIRSGHAADRRRKFCNRQCANVAIGAAHRGENHPQWRGGTTVTVFGYRMVYKPDHPNANRQGQVHEHRLTMESVLGRYLEPHEIVHHKNGDKLDNRPGNLQLTTREEHPLLHHPGYVMSHCAECGQEIYRVPAQLKRVKFVACSYRCAALVRHRLGVHSAA